MKVVILGAGGYIGGHLCETLERDSHEIFPVTRVVIDFDKDDSFVKLEGVLSREKPKLVINAIGSIDLQIQGNARQLFNSTLFPTYCLYQHYSGEGKEDSATIIILGSTAAGEPRTGYPLYAALKASEMALSRTALDAFDGTKITWKIITVPRLLGGLGVSGKKDIPSQNIFDKDLIDLTANIRDEIVKIEWGTGA